MGAVAALKKIKRAGPEELREGWDVGHLEIQLRTTAYLAYGVSAQ